MANNHFYWRNRKPCREPCLPRKGEIPSVVSLPSYAYISFRLICRKGTTTIAQKTLINLLWTWQPFIKISDGFVFSTWLLFRWQQFIWKTLLIYRERSVSDTREAIRKGGHLVSWLIRMQPARVSLADRISDSPHKAELAANSQRLSVAASMSKSSDVAASFYQRSSNNYHAGRIPTWKSQ